MTTEEPREGEKAGGPGEESATAPSTPLLPSLTRHGPWWVGALALLAAAAAMIWRCG